MTTTVQVHRGQNGDDVIEVTGQEHIQDITDGADAVVLDGNSGMNEAQVQLQVQAQPQLFDIDLERMNRMLYEDRYLTPDNFLEDIRKIVHNANVRSQDDPERLFRAQAMLTAAEVSCLDFDVNFRLECQRMAIREQQRRNQQKHHQHSRSNEENLQQESLTPPVRRSARNNGQAPEISITDPLQLERKLKRARSIENTVEPSEGEAGEGHTVKRSRVSSVEMDGQESIVEPENTLTQVHAVRFADNLNSMLEPLFRRPPVIDPGLALFVSQSNQELPVPDSEIDSSPLKPIIVDGPHTSFSDVQLSTSGVQQPTFDSMLQPDINGISLATEEGHPSGTADLSAELPDVAVTEPVTVEHVDAMEVERVPTPLPDFHADQQSLSQLKEDLRTVTEPLNVEELEQLRAMCLARVWKHRSDWDRTVLIDELRHLVHEFVREMYLNDIDAETPNI